MFLSDKNESAEKVPFSSPSVNEMGIDIQVRGYQKDLAKFALKFNEQKPNFALFAVDICISTVLKWKI